MNDTVSPEHGDAPANEPAPNRDREQLTLALLAEELAVERRTVVGDTVRIASLTRERTQMIDEPLTHQRVEVERVAVGRPVDAVPPVREEGDTTIIPIVEETLVVERRLILKEEVRIRRVRVVENHHEAVVLREQEAVVARSEAGSMAGRRNAPSASTGPSNLGASLMSETIIAIYDSAAHADAAVRDLKDANVPADAITQHSGTAATTSSDMGTGREPGFWSSLFGGEPDHDASIYERSIEGGSTVVSVKVPGEHYEAIAAILERHDPIDMDERAASYGAAGPVDAAGRSPDYGATTGTAPAARTTPQAGDRPTERATDGGTMKLAEETLSVGKRVVGGGTTRIRRYVVETPVEEQVTLHTENVTIDRRPVTDGEVIDNPDFTDKTIEMTETSEEAVVSKKARVTEEISLRKDVSDRVETVKDTVRREEVDVEQAPGGTATTGSKTDSPPRV